MLYLDLDELDELASKLDEAQPFIGSLADDNSLNGLLSIIGQAISQEIVELPADLNPLLNKIRRAVNAAGEAKTYRLSWQQEMLGEDRDLLRTQRFILLKPKLDFNELVPAEKSLAAVRVIVDEAKTVFPDVSMHLTGEVVLEHDELISVTRSAEIALIFSVTLVFMVLYIGLRSIRMVLVTLTVLLMGLLLTSGFAALAIGHLNIISIAFAVLYIGIGVDYTIQLCLRYRELRQNELPRSQALRDAVRKVGPSITLCALTTSAAFFIHSDSLQGRFGTGHHLRRGHIHLPPDYADGAAGTAEAVQGGYFFSYHRGIRRNVPGLGLPVPNAARKRCPVDVGGTGSCRSGAVDADPVRFQSAQFARSRQRVRRHIQGIAENQGHLADDVNRAGQEQRRSA
nr:MMPL family transporter [Methylomarinum sp. Ch1-1]MDP4522528.1 MMPL family transporter [Methylomarinum sp. Ch1-1]